MKREDFHDRCQACYDENEADIVRQIESGVKIPLDRNLIGWEYATSQPGLHDYLWYFLKWLFRPKTVIVADRPYRFANDGTPIYGYQPRNPLLDRPMNPALDIIVNKNGKPPQIGSPIGRYYPATDTWEPAPYVKDEYEDDVWYTKSNTDRRG